MSKTTKKIKRKNTARSRRKYPQFESRYSPKIRAEYMDYEDYAKNLPEDEFVTLPNGKEVSIKEWYHKFVSEYDGASLDYKNLENNLHNTKELKTMCTDQNNARNRCKYGIAKAGGKVLDVFELEPTIYNESETEDIMIDIIDGLRDYKEESEED